MKAAFAIGWQILLISLGVVCQAQETAHLNFLVSDADGKEMPCRIHVRDSTGAAQFAEGMPSWKDHFVCPGKFVMELKPDEYSFQVERGPEFERVKGSFVAEKGKSITIHQRLHRLASMRGEGWFSGDLHVHRPAADVELLMAAEDLDYLPVIGWWNQPAPNASPLPEIDFATADGRIYSIGAGEDEREGGALLYIGLKQPLDLSVRSREFPSPMKFVNQARAGAAKVWVDIEKPFWWDVPVWLAVARPDSIGIAHNHMHRDGVLGNEAWGRPRDPDQYRGIHGNGHWTQQIYYHILNSGIQIPPSAGSASGVLPNPVGYNRVYVHLGQTECTRDNWFDALKAGKCFVTNGPLLRVRANGKYSGADIPFQAGETIALAIELDSNDPVSSLEVIHNGNVIKRISTDRIQHQTINTEFVLPGPGWFLVRAIADVRHTFRFASTAPWYVLREDGSEQVSQVSTQFFLDWLNERIERVKKNVQSTVERDLVLLWHYQARSFWQNRHRNANADLLPLRDGNWQQMRNRLRAALHCFNVNETTQKVLSDLKQVGSRLALNRVVQPLVVLDVSINPESRVKVASRLGKLSLEQNRPQQFFVQIDNLAGITAALNLSAIDLALNPPGVAKWCSIEIVDDPFTSRYLSGETTEFKVVEITPHAAGIREVRIVGDAGQGTQDLGFRATTDVLIDVQPASTDNDSK